MIARQPKQLLRAIARCQSGLSLLEFALGLPIFLTLILTGAETANWIITKMRISQVALQLADNAARMGDGELLQAKTVSETDVNDVLTGGGLQAGELDLYNNGRVILSDVEKAPSPNPDDKNYIKWQRCRGTNTHTSQYGNAAVPVGGVILPTDRVDGVGPGGRQVDAQDDNATMFVEVYYEYSPLVSSQFAPSMTFDEIASMAVRDRRDLAGGNNGIYNAENAPKSTCNKFNAG